MEASDTTEGRRRLRLPAPQGDVLERIPYRRHRSDAEAARRTTQLRDSIDDDRIRAMPDRRGSGAGR